MKNWITENYIFIVGLVITIAVGIIATSKLGIELGILLAFLPYNLYRLLDYHGPREALEHIKAAGFMIVILLLIGLGLSTR